MIKFSVIIPVWNAAKTIEGTLQCVFNQRYQPDEIIIINDGSTDSTQTILDAISCYKDITVKSIENSGPSTARNTGASIARNDYLAFLDADDYWAQDHLENLSNLIQENPSSSLYISGYTIVTKRPCKEYDDNISDKSYHQVVKLFDLNSYVLERLRGRRVAWTSAVTVRKSDFFYAGGFDPNFKHGEDQGLWLRLVSNGAAAKSARVTAQYVKNDQGLSSKLVSDIDGCMHASEVLINSGKFSRRTNFLLREFYNKYALIHAANAIRRADYETCKRFVSLSSFTIIFFHKRVILGVLAALLPYFSMIFSRGYRNQRYKSKEK